MRASLATPLVALFLAAACGGQAPAASPATSATAAATIAAADFELWVPDQAETTPTGGGTLNIYRGSDLAKPGTPNPAYSINLAEAALGVGDGMGKHPHNVTFTAAGTHAVISYVGSGHVQVIRAGDRKVVASIKMSATAAGNPAAHNSAVTPAGDAIIVANQGAKKLQRISADFKNDIYKLDPAADLDLAALEDATHTGNNPVMALFTQDGKYTYVPQRGGGAYLVDYAATPMKTVASLGKSDISAQSCCAVALKDGTIWTTAQGGPTSTTTAFNLVQVTWTASSLSAKKLLARTGNVESHSVLAVGQYVWVADRFANTIDIFDSKSAGEPLATISLATGPLAGRDPAPDIMDLSPDGTSVFVALRGKAPVTSNIKDLGNAVGDVGGFAIVGVKDAGRSAEVRSFVSLTQGAGASTVDPHGLRVRTIAR
jgi:DNA-binding beta-propeller fold protein YncE